MDYNNRMSRFTVWKEGLYEIEYSPSLVTISKGGYYVRIEGKEAVCVFDVFTDDCTNLDAIDKYFDIAKIQNNEY
jgi:hypothetical protein